MTGSNAAKRHFSYYPLAHKKKNQHQTVPLLSNTESNSRSHYIHYLIITSEHTRPCFGCLQTRELNTAVQGSTMNTNCTWPWKISIIPEPRQSILEPTASVKGCTGPCRLNSMSRPFERRSTTPFRNCRMIWTSGWKNTTTSELTPVSTATAVRQCKHLWKPYL